YLTNQDANSVSLIDTTSNAVTATVPAGQLPNGLAITPDGRHAYLANTGSGSVTVLTIS
ncbi:MAG: hypothetical protein JWQ60_1977, partial [Pseudonocardia sp.]|nr:hypothetical protein [Pseudonocardia sp.]